MDHGVLRSGTGCGGPGDSVTVQDEIGEAAYRSIHRARIDLARASDDNERLGAARRLLAWRKALWAAAKRNPRYARWLEMAKEVEG